TLADVRVAVEDWMPIRHRMRELAAELRDDPPPLPADEVNEARALLERMEGEHFVFLGYRYYRLERGTSQDKLLPEPRTGLGILRAGHGEGPRAGRARAIVLRGEIREHARARELLILTKANS